MYYQIVESIDRSREYRCSSDKKVGVGCRASSFVWLSISARKLVENLFERGFLDLILSNHVFFLHILNEAIHPAKTDAISCKSQAYASPIYRLEGSL